MRSGLFGKVGNCLAASTPKRISLFSAPFSSQYVRKAIPALRQSCAFYHTSHDGSKRVELETKLAIPLVDWVVLTDRNFSKVPKYKLELTQSNLAKLQKIDRDALNKLYLFMHNKKFRDAPALKKCAEDIGLRKANGTIDHDVFKILSLMITKKGMHYKIKLAVHKDNIILNPIVHDLNRHLMSPDSLEEMVNQSLKPK